MRSLRLKAITASISAAALLLAVALPHHHDSSLRSHPETCRACRIQQHFSAAPEAPSAAAVQPLPVVPRVVCPDAAPRVQLVVRPAPSRAPPILS